MQTQNNVSALRDILFAELRALDKNSTATDIARAKAKSELAQTIIETAKVEIDFARITKQNVESEFIATATAPTPSPKLPPKVSIVENGGVLKHRMGG